MMQFYRKLLIILFVFSSYASQASSISSSNYCLNPILSSPLQASASITGSTTVCLNANEPTITFSVSGGGNNNPYTFNYTINNVPQTALSSGSGNNSVTLPAPTNVAGIFTYVLTSVTNNGGQTVDIQNSTDTVTITVVSTTVQFTFNDNQCSGTSVQFNTNSNGNSYTWNFGDGGTSSAQNPTHTYISLGCNTVTYNVTLTVTGLNGCSNTVTHTVTIKQAPDISFGDLVNPFDPFSNCANASASNPDYQITVENLSVSTACITTYNIAWGDASNSPNVTFPVQHNYSQLRTYTMVITAVGQNGCSSSKTYTIKKS